MFYIGQKVVCIKKSVAAPLVVDKIYTTEGLLSCSCSTNISVGLLVSPSRNGTRCYRCGEIINRSLQWYHNSNMFMPLDSYSEAVKAVESLSEPETIKL